MFGFYGSMISFDLNLDDLVGGVFLDLGKGKDVI